MCKCPVKRTHKTLIESYILWMTALEYYHVPVLFCTNVNAFIQAIRNITFHLQKEKRSEDPDFDGWYSRWKESLKEDEIMRWINESRAKIVHESGLEPNSEATVTIQNYEKIKNKKINVPIFHDGEKIIKKLFSDDTIKKEYVTKDAHAVIERKWVVEDFPRYELLYLLGHAFIRMYDLVQDAHKKYHCIIEDCDEKSDFSIDIEKFREYIESNPKILEKEVYRLDDLSKIITRHKPFDEEEQREIVAEVVKNFDRVSVGPSERDNPFEYAETLLKFFKELAILYGVPPVGIVTAYLQFPNLSWDKVIYEPEDTTFLHIICHQLSERIEKEGIVSIIVQTVILKTDGSEEIPEISVSVFTLDYDTKSYYAPFHINAGKLKFGRTSKQKRYPPFLEPISMAMYKKYFDK